MKLNIAGLFRSLLGKAENSQPEPARAEEPTLAHRSIAATDQAAEPLTASTDDGFAQDSSLPEAAPDTGRPDEIGVSLLAIANSLPIDLKAKLIGMPAPGRMVYLPLENVVSQLAFGAVKISFGELRQLAPGIFVAGLNGTFDSRPVTLPLSEILARINPALLARRPSAHKLEVADEIAGPFADQGRGITFTEQPLKGPPVAPVTASTRSVKPESPGLAKREVRPSTPVVPPRETKPPTPANLTPPSLPMTPRIPTDSGRPAKNGNGNVIGRANGNEHGNGNGNGHGNGNGQGNGNGAALPQKPKTNPGPTLPPFKFNTSPIPPATPPVAPQPTVAKMPPATPPKPATPGSMTPAPAPSPKPAFAAEASFSVWLQELSEKWPDEIKNEIVAEGLANAKVPLAMGRIEPGLKLGRVTMAWRELRTLVNPNSAPSSVDDLELDLPLNVLAPAFLATQRKLSSQAPARVTVSEEIPNLFFGFPQPEAPAPSAPVSTPPKPMPSAPTPSPVFRQAPLPRRSPETGETPGTVHLVSPVAKQSPAGDTNIFPARSNGGSTSEDSTFIAGPGTPSTDFMSRQMQPKDVIAHAVQLPGVAGAVIALADGLRVAGQVPPEFSADTVAAFLPQIFERVNQCTRELRMGGLNNVSFTVGSVPWKIFRINSIYFAAFGRPAEPFPKAELAQLAAGLNRKSKQ